MPEHYEVRWSDSAATDLEEIIRFIAADSPLNAERVFENLIRKAQTLQRFPQRTRVVPELKAIGLDIYRELLAGPYRILIRVKERGVFVLGVFDGRRDLEEILLERLTRPPL